MYDRFEEKNMYKRDLLCRYNVPFGVFVIARNVRVDRKFRQLFITDPKRTAAQ